MRAAIDTAGLRRELALRGMTQAELASIAGVSEPTVSHAMSGRMVSYLTIRKFARALTVTPALPGTQGIIGPQKEAAIESPSQAAATATSHTHEPFSDSALNPGHLAEAARLAPESRP